VGQISGVAAVMKALSLWATKADIDALREDLQAILVLADRAPRPAAVEAAAPEAVMTAADPGERSRPGWGWQFWTSIAVIVLVGAISTVLLRVDTFLIAWWLAPVIAWWSAFIIAGWPWLLSGAAAIALFAAWWLWWRLPKRQVDRLRAEITDAKARADVEDNFRKTIGQLLGGVAVLIAAGFAYLQFQQQQTSAHDLLISNQVAKGFELLGNKEKSVSQRLGGIYALESVMNNSDQYHQPVLEALCAFVRDETRTKTGDDPPTTEVQAALTVIGRRKAGAGFVDLSDARIPNAVLFHADLSGDFPNEADLTGVDMSGAILHGAKLTRATLTDAKLVGAHLPHADLGGADLTDADLSGADLQEAKLGGAHMENTKLNGADLRRAENFMEWQLEIACGDENTKLEPPLTIKPCPKHDGRTNTAS
jgi:uncharacterized protein YjbI with pentapeptide repeats